jgi:hypothetical protein
MKHTLILALVASLGLAACSKKEEPTAQAGHPAMATAQMPNSGRVVEVIQAGQYTYIEAMVGNGEKIWMAGAHVEAKAGDPLQFGQGGVMQNFTAKSINRTFERILFVDNWSVGGAAASVAAHGSMPPGSPAPIAALPGNHPPMGNMPVGAPAGAPQGGGNSGVVKSITNAGGYSYVEVQQGNGSVWVAAPEAKVKAGDKVSWDGGSVMQNFAAKSLNRTFDQIIFAGGLNVAK